MKYLRKFYLRKKLIKYENIFNILKYKPDIIMICEDNNQ